MLKFDLPKNQSSIIKVLGVGGGGSNAVNHMFKQGITDVDFIVCNTDAQALMTSPISTKIQLGSKGLGAGSIPSVGRESAKENIEDLKEILEKNTKMLFITAGMGGGTGTGAAPVIAETAREMGILTIGIVTVPFAFEGRKRKQQAELGIKELREHVDSLLIICNDKLRELYGDLKLSEAFGKADDVLTTAAKGIAEIITVPGYINVDFEDVKSVMSNSGVAIMGTGISEGDNRAIKAAELALSSPLLNDNNIIGADNILLYISSGTEEITLDEVTEITDYIQSEAGNEAEIIWGNGVDSSLDNKICATLIATGFETSSELGFMPTAKSKNKKVIYKLENEKPETKKPNIEPKINLVSDEDPEESKAEEKKLTATGIRMENKEEAPKNEENIFNFTIKSSSKKTGESKGTTMVKKKEEQPDEEHEEMISRKNNEDVEMKYTHTDEDYPDIAEKSLERIKRLRAISFKLKTAEGLAEIENKPAYQRRNIELKEVKPSNETEISRYTLSENEEKKTEIKTNNSYLHDNVD